MALARCWMLCIGRGTNRLPEEIKVQMGKQYLSNPGKIIFPLPASVSASWGIHKILARHDSTCRALPLTGDAEVPGGQCYTLPRRTGQ